MPLSVQLETLNVPLLLLAKLTVPVGVVFVPLSVSVTVAVQVVEPFTRTGLGVQLTVVLVDRLGASVNAVCAVQPDAWPVAVARKVTPRSEGWTMNWLLVNEPLASAAAVRFVSGSPLDSRMLMVTVSLGCHPSPISVTVSPGA